MKAFICTKYGTPDVLQLKEVEKPVPKDNEILIKNFATTANAADARIRGAVFPSVFKYLVPLALGIGGPRKKILGVELAGKIVETGKNVTKFSVGDEIMASAGESFGAYAEYTCLPEAGVISQKPKNVTFEEAAAVPHCALAALHYIKLAKIKEAQQVLIYGASGGIGTFAVQLAKYYGAKVTGVCSTSNIEMVKSIGADEVIDYTKEKISVSGKKYDIVFDTIGKAELSESKQALKEKGKHLSAVHLELGKIFNGIWISMTTGKKVIGGVANYTAEMLNELKELIEAGELKTIVDKQYPFEDLPEAHSYVDKGHKKGHVLIHIATK